MSFRHKILIIISISFILLLGHSGLASTNDIIASIDFNSKDPANKLLILKFNIKFFGKAGFLNKELFVEKDGSVSWNFQNLKAGKYILKLETGAGVARTMEVQRQFGLKWLSLGLITSNKPYEYKTTEFFFEVKSSVAKQRFRLQAKGKGIGYLHKAMLIFKPVVSIDKQANKNILNSSATATITNANGLQLNFTAQGRIKEVLIKKNNIAATQALGSSGLNISSINLPIKKIKLKNKMIQIDKNTVCQQFSSEHGQLNGKLIFSNYGQYIKVSGNIRSSSDHARGVRIKFSLPIEATKWSWAGAIDQGQKITSSGKRYSNSYKFDPHAFLTDGKQTSLKNENVAELYRQSYSFCTAIYNKQRGLSLAIPRDQYQMVDMSYESSDKSYDIIYSMGLDPQSKRPNQATFTFYITTINPRWGYRSALNKYYSTFSNFFVKRVKREGSMFPFINAEIVKNSDEFGHYFNWSGMTQTTLDMLDIYNFSYSVPGQLFVHLKNASQYSAEKVPLELITTALKRDYSGQGTTKSLCYDEKKRPIIGNTTYADFIVTVNNDPALPYGQYYKKYIMSRVAKTNGVAYDGLLGGLNYRKSHFSKTSFPLMYNPLVKKCMINNYYSCLELAKSIYQEFNKKDKYIVGNAVPENFLFGAPLQDIITEECSVNISYSALLHYRQTMYRKPVCLLAKNYWINSSKEQVENFIKRCLAVGVFPGFFDASPSSNHPYSSYWMHPQWYNRDRTIWRKYNQLIREIAHAGWNPIPYAEVTSNSQIKCERFGAIQHGTIFYTIRTENKAGTNIFKINKKAQQISGKIIIFDEINNRIINYSEDADFVTVELTLKTNDVKLISINTPDNFKRRKIDNALAWLRSREKSFAVNQQFGNKLTQWAANRTWKHNAYSVTGNAAHTGRQSITNHDGLDISQALYLKQKKSHNLLVGIWSKSQNASGATVNITVHGLNSNCTNDKKYTIELVPGTHDWEFQELKIPVKTQVESVKVSLNYKGIGKVWLDDISLKSAADNYQQELIADNSFEERFLSPVLREQLDHKMLELKKILVVLKGNSNDKTNALRVNQQINNIILWVKTNNMQIQAARELRDLADIKRFLKPLYPEHTPVVLQITAPSAVAPGKIFQLSVNLKNNQQKPITLQAPELALTNSAEWSTSRIVDTPITLLSGKSIDIQYRVTVPKNTFGKKSEFRFWLKALSLISNTYCVTVEPFYLGDINISNKGNQLKITALLANNLSDTINGQLELTIAKGKSQIWSNSKKCSLTANEQKKIVFIVEMEKLRRGHLQIILTFKSNYGSLAIQQKYAYKNIAHFKNGAIIKVDGAMERYTAKPINDGITAVTDLKWYDAAWAVAGEGAHWIEVKLPRPKKIDQVVIFWQRENSATFPSQKFTIQVWQDNRWIDKFTTNSNVDEISDIKIKPVTTSKVRVYQPRQGGPVGRENIMWVRELEIY